MHSLESWEIKYLKLRINVQKKFLNYVMLINFIISLFLKKKITLQPILNINEALVKRNLAVWDNTSKKGKEDSETKKNKNDVNEDSVSWSKPQKVN